MVTTTPSCRGLTFPRHAKWKPYRALRYALNCSVGGIKMATAAKSTGCPLKVPFAPADTATAATETAIARPTADI